MTAVRFQTVGETSDILGLLSGMVMRSNRLAFSVRTVPKYKQLLFLNHKKIIFPEVKEEKK